MAAQVRKSQDFLSMLGPPWPLASEPCPGFLPTDPLPQMPDRLSKLDSQTRFSLSCQTFTF